MWSADTHTPPNVANQPLVPVLTHTRRSLLLSSFFVFYFFSPFPPAHMRLISHSTLSSSHLSAFVFSSFIISAVTESDSGAGSVWSLSELSSIWQIRLILWPTKRQTPGKMQPAAELLLLPHSLVGFDLVEMWILQHAKRLHPISRPGLFTKKMTSA